MYVTITTNIMVNNVKETIKFYVENLGFQKVLSVPEDGDILNFAILSKALYDELKEKVQIAKELHQTFYGQDEFAIFDNNGNILTISC